MASSPAVWPWSRQAFTAALWAWVALAPVGRAGPAAADPAPFGFAGREIFPIDPSISHLRAADLDGDGLMDLVVVNNSRSKINLLYNQTRQPKSVVASKRLRRELNELPPDARFRVESMASEKRIAELVVADLNSDHRPDLAYYGEPKELVLLSHEGTNGWSPPKRWPLEDGQLGPNMLVSGDLNGDGRTDLLLLGESCLYLLAQQSDRSLAEPEKIPFSGTLKSIQVLDIDGNGREDLLLVNWDTPNPLRFRLQNDAGQLGPEVHFSLPPIRSYWADNLDGDRKTEIVTIAQNSGRAQIANFIRKPADKLSDTFRAGQFQIFPLNKTTKARRGSLWADVNRDQRPDLVVAEPESGQMAISLQQADGSLAPARTFPTLTGVTSVQAADWDGDGRPELFLLSADERQVGVTRYTDQGRVAFPTLIPVEGKPLAIAVGSLAAQDQLRLALVLDQDGKRLLLTRTATGKTTSQPLHENFKSNPSAMAFHDVDQDGLMDLVILIPYEKIKILRQEAGQAFKELDIAPPGGTMDQPWLSRADVDGDGRPELLLAQKNFLRAVVLKPADNPDGAQSWSFAVKDQINGAWSNSRIVGAAPLRPGTNAVPALFLLDAERKALTLCQRDSSGVWQVAKNLSLPFTEFVELQALALGGAEANSVAFLGLNAVAWLPLHGETWDLKELDGYETPIKDGRLNDVISGDLNQDQRKDLVFLETARNYLDVVSFTSRGKLVPGNRWQVFEERTFRSRRSDLPEPREAFIADFTGDGKNDLVILVHDRVILYPQE